MRHEDIANLFEIARTSPTVEVWELIIRATLSGRLDGIVGRYLGNVEEVMATNIKNSLDPFAEATFKTALERVASDWNPAAVTSASSTESMLRLIQEYLPPSGFIKLLGYLIEGGTFPAASLGTVDDAPQDLEELAWATLARYFPVAPKEPAAFPAFETYCRFLVSGLTNPTHRGEACVRLVEVEYFSSDGANLGELIHSHPEEIVPALVEWLLATQRRDRDSLLSNLYLHCQASKLARVAFETALEHFGASAILTNSRAVVTFRDGSSVSIPFTSEGAYEMTMSKEWQDMSDLGYDRLSQMTAEDTE